MPGPQLFIINGNAQAWGDCLGFPGPAQWRRAAKRK